MPTIDKFDDRYALMMGVNQGIPVRCFYDGWNMGKMTGDKEVVNCVRLHRRLEGRRLVIDLSHKLTLVRMNPNHVSRGVTLESLPQGNLTQRPMVSDKLRIDHAHGLIL